MANEIIDLVPVSIIPGGNPEKNRTKSLAGRRRPHPLSVSNHVNPTMPEEKAFEEIISAGVNEGLIELMPLK